MIFPRVNINTTSSTRLRRERASLILFFATRNRNSIIFVISEGNAVSAFLRVMSYSLIKMLCAAKSSPSNDQQCRKAHCSISSGGMNLEQATASTRGRTLFSLLIVKDSWLPGSRSGKAVTCFRFRVFGRQFRSSGLEAPSPISFKPNLAPESLILYYIGISKIGSGRHASGFSCVLDS